MYELTKLQQFVLFAIPTLFAITLHEVAHGWMALKRGDRTAQILGRLTLNPLKHIDPLGTVLIPTLLFFTTGFIFGWAKPVPVTFQNLRNQRRDMAFVAVAGPLANLFMAIFWGIIWKLSLFIYQMTHPIGFLMAYMCRVGIIINLVLMALNFLPIPPLDGSRIVSSLLSPKLSWRYNQIEPYGFFILIGLMITGILGKILLPIVILVNQVIVQVFQLPVFN